MFLGREKELQELDRLFFSNKFQMFVLYGRRRVGKTTLLKEFCKGKNSIFFSAERSNEKMNLDKFSEIVFTHFDETIYEPFSSWEKALLYLDEKAAHVPLILVLDEFPYLAGANRAMLSMLQHMIDHKLKEGKLFLILSGSYMGFMEKEVLGAESPIFGRRTGQLHMKAFDYLDSGKFFPSLDAQDKLLYYGIFGGTPMYLANVDPSIGILQNIKNNYLKPTGYLYEEPLLLLQQELQEPSVYCAIIEAIACGAVRLNEIHQKTGEDAAKCAKYISVLRKLGIVYKELPLGEKKSSRKGIYRIQDPMFLFWNRFVSPNKTLIETDAADLLLKKKIEPQLNHYMGFIFEKICTQFLLRENSLGKLPLLATEVGRWWGNDSRSRREIEIDILAKDHDVMLFGECKWRNEKTDMEVLDALIEKSQIFHCNQPYYMLFSKSGFTEQVRRRALKQNDVLLYELEDLYCL